MSKLEGSDAYMSEWDMCLGVLEVCGQYESV